jgi:hypothetical protein
MIEIGQKCLETRSSLTTPIIARLAQMQTRKYVLLPVFMLQRWLRSGIVVLSGDERSTLSDRLRRVCLVPQLASLSLSLSLCVCVCVLLILECLPGVC